MHVRMHGGKGGHAHRDAWGKAVMRRDDNIWIKGKGTSGCMRYRQ
jgi:hypothetical protein